MARRVECNHEVTRQICECPWYDARCHECPSVAEIPACLRVARDLEEGN